MKKWCLGLLLLCSVTGLTAGCADSGSSDPIVIKDTYISLEGNSIAVNGSGVTTYGSDAIINASGTYYLKGSLEDGSIEVNPAGNGEVNLILNGADVINKDGPALLVSSGTCRVTTANGTKNVLADETPEPNTYNCAIYSKKDLTFSGQGQLNVDGDTDSGIICEEDVTFNSGTVKVDADSDGIRARNASFNGGSITIVSATDGVYTSEKCIVNGSELVSLASTLGKSGGIEADGDFLIKAGMVLATGEINEMPDSGNVLPYVKANVPAKDGDKLVIRVKNTTVAVLTATLSLNGSGKMSEMLFSCADLTEGVEYDILVNNVIMATVKAKK